ncbi:hypothetical protein TruAng_009726 [Truncatella angustata]|nr:hypothetical protein TruAng_009726 [Truncatella angustata]
MANSYEAAKVMHKLSAKREPYHQDAIDLTGVESTTSSTQFTMATDGVPTSTFSTTSQEKLIGISECTQSELLDFLGMIDLETILQDARVQKYMDKKASRGDVYSQNQMDHLVDQTKGHEAQILNLKATVNDLRVKVDHSPPQRLPTYHFAVPKDMALQSHNYKRKLETLRKDLTEKEEECAQLLEAWQKAIEEAQALQPTDHKFTVDDDTVTSKFRSLHDDIRNLTSLHFSIKIFRRVRARDHNHFVRICPTYATFLGDKYLAPYLFQAYIWHFLCKNLFGCPLRIFGTGAMDNVDQLRCLIDTSKHGDAKKDAQQLRAMNCQFLHKHRGIKGQLDDKLTEKLCREGFLGHVSVLCHDEIKKDLKTIMSKAIELAVIFVKSRSEFRCANVRIGKNDTEIFYGFQAVKPWTQIVSGNARHNDVKLIASPVLMKRGNSKGEEYDKTLVLVPADVCC